MSDKELAVIFGKIERIYKALCYKGLQVEKIPIFIGYLNCSALPLLPLYKPRRMLYSSAFAGLFTISRVDCNID